MKHIEPVSPAIGKDLTPRIRDFWTRRVNAERIMGRDVTAHERGEDGYFRDLETQRYRSHRHLLPWIAAMTPGKTVLEIGSGVGLDTYAMAKHGLEVTAVDLTDVGVATARQRFLRHRMRQISWQRMPATCRSLKTVSITFTPLAYCITLPTPKEAFRRCTGY